MKFKQHILDKSKFYEYTNRVFKDVYVYMNEPTKNEIWFKSLMFRLRQLRKLESIFYPEMFYRHTVINELRAKLLKSHESKKTKRVDEIQRRLKGL